MAVKRTFNFNRTSSISIEFSTRGKLAFTVSGLQVTDPVSGNLKPIIAAEPTEDNGVATKKYVDDRIGGTDETIGVIYESIPEWDIATTYNEDDLVWYQNGGIWEVYKSLVDSNTGNTPPSSGDYWVLVTSPTEYEDFTVKSAWADGKFIKRVSVMIMASSNADPSVQDATLQIFWYKSGGTPDKIYVGLAGLDLHDDAGSQYHNIDIQLPSGISDPENYSLVTHYVQGFTTENKPANGGIAILLDITTPTMFRRQNS